MKSQDLKQFSKLMVGLAENFSSQMTEPGIAMRFEALREYPIDDITAAASKIVKTRTMMGMPTVAEFIVAMGASEPTIVDSAHEQVNVVMRQIRDLGSYRTPAFDDPITKSLMSSRWSWQSICSMTEAEHKWWAKEFTEAYQSANHSGTLPQIDVNNSRLRLLAGGIGR